MIQMDLQERFSMLVDLIKSDNFFMFLLVVMILLLYVMYDTVKSYIRNAKLVYASIYLAIICVAIIKYHSIILSVLDNFMNQLFVMIYFPNFVFYLLIILAANIILLSTVFNRRISKFIRILNVTSFCILLFLFILIFNNVLQNKVDVYSQLSIYTHKDLMMLIQFSTEIFAVWMVLLIINWIINKICKIHLNFFEKKLALTKKDYQIVLKILKEHEEEATQENLIEN